ncbi:MAG: FAD:protein FMN transferase [Succinivibrio sp.]|jgi:thiamine biosynthesis lipoprotein|nr:FAD:protein FMN transferase [Succinivibrio sp.]
MKAKSAFMLITAAALLCACGKAQPPAPEVTRAQGKTMGTFYMVETVGNYKDGAAALEQDCEAEFKQITDAISTFDPHSELASINAAQTTEPQPISPYLSRIIADTVAQGLRIGLATDITVGPLVNLWGFGKDKRLNREPSQDEIAEALKLTGRQAFELRHTRSGQNLIIKHDPKVSLDLSTIGEGLGADAVAAMLDRAGVQNYLASVAGASRTAGKNPRGEDWKIGIEDPTNPDHQVFQTVCPLGQGMSTAGSYRNYFKDEKTGHIYSHAIDPKTGRPVDHSTMSVTVIARRAFITDALDTGLLVMGADKALTWANAHNVAIFTIEMKDGKPFARYSRAFAQYLKCAPQVNATLEEN